MKVAAKWILHVEEAFLHRDNAFPSVKEARTFATSLLGILIDHRDRFRLKPIPAVNDERWLIAGRGESSCIFTGRPAKVQDKVQCQSEPQSSRGEQLAAHLSVANPAETRWT